MSSFFFNDTATTEIYTLSLHDALPILRTKMHILASRRSPSIVTTLTSGSRWRTSDLRTCQALNAASSSRSEEHTSELQSPDHLVCRLLLEKKKKATHKYLAHHMTT